MQDNIFNTMAALVPPKSFDLGDELECYLHTDAEHVVDPLAWWNEWCTVYPSLLRMSLDYLTIPGKYWTLYFSLKYGGQFTDNSFSYIYWCETPFQPWPSHCHTHTLLSFNSDYSCDSMCLEAWSLLTLIKIEDVMAVATLEIWRTMRKQWRMVGTGLCYSTNVTFS